MYEQIDVWRRIGPQLARRYRCFRVLGSDRYCVQSADFLRLPLDPSRLADLERQFCELLIEIAPDERSPTFETLEEAVTAFDREFGNV